MKVISLINQKGGAGKTTVARGLLSAANAAGMSCAFLETDPTENTLKWAKRAAAAGNWSDSIEAFHELNPDEARKVVLELDDDGDIDLLIIDTEGSASELHDQLAIVSDLILCPIQPSESDFETAVGTANWHYRLRQRVDDASQLPPLRVVLNRIDSKPGKDEKDIIEYARITPLIGDGDSAPVEKFQFMEQVIHQLKAYRRMDKEGLLGKLIENDKARIEAFFKNPRYLKIALLEMSKLLQACLTEMEGTS